jgi:ABC-type multidrug transport system fused ATPase/permease subunit
MEQAFIDILKQLVKEQSSAALKDAKKCKSILTDYTKNQYQKESRLIIQAVEAGVPKAIEGAEDLAACKKGKIRELEEDYGYSSASSADIVNALALVLRGDTTVTVLPTAAVLPSSPPAQQKAASVPPQSAPSAEAVKNTATEIKRKILPLPIKTAELKSVSQVYPGGVKAVDNINLVVFLQEFLVLLGPPDCGKSTILRLIAGYDEITEGELLINGKHGKIQ